jgi:peroxiredoxin
MAAPETFTKRLIPLLLLSALPLAAQSVIATLGHSKHGSAFDTGPREKPWPIEGIGTAHFPITTKDAEVQKWFDQGNALLHSFWDYEAERAFRWCLKLEPDNAMAYWGLARAASVRGGGTRPADMIREAVKRRATVSPREQLYIDALAADLLPDTIHSNQGADSDRQDGSSRAQKILESLCVKYPDDMEARALLALETMGGNRYGAELIIREILAKQPDHPGAHHYRIHNWDYNEPEQALESARRYGDIAPAIGHALHMPGHIFSIVGMWNEAAVAMDAATRREKQYMQQRLTFPFNNWNYGHNRNYLSYIQEQLGMADAALFGAHQLIDAPLDPEGNDTSPYSSHSAGIAGLARGLLKFERWDEILKEDSIPWRDILADRVHRAYTEARAHLGKGDTDLAEKSLLKHRDLKSELDKEKNTQLGTLYEIESLELRGRIAIARGETLAGLKLLTEAAEKEFDLQKTYADPPVYPESLYNTLGEAYLKAHSPILAVQSFEKALTLTRNDLFSLSGLVRAYAATGDKAKAEDSMARLLYVTAGADKNLAIVQRAIDTGITATPHDSSPGPQRSYAQTALDQYGPAKWEPYAAPKLDTTDSAGKRVTLDDYKGKNVILVFYLGQECPHCMRQLHDLVGKKEDWDRLNVELLAVSSTPAAQNAKTLKEFGSLPIRLLSDKQYDNARRFHSYDDFEEAELHSTILIDRNGRVHWARNGGDPFSDMAFLVKQTERMNAATR